eukprot:3931935-Rhodomonas_salina.3
MKSFKEDAIQRGGGTFQLNANRPFPSKRTPGTNTSSSNSNLGSHGTSPYCSSTVLLLIVLNPTYRSAWRICLERIGAISYSHVSQTFAMRNATPTLEDCSTLAFLRLGRPGCAARPGQTPG